MSPNQEKGNKQQKTSNENYSNILGSIREFVWALVEAVVTHTSSTASLQCAVMRTMDEDRSQVNSHQKTPLTSNVTTREGKPSFEN